METLGPRLGVVIGFHWDQNWARRHDDRKRIRIEKGHSKTEEGETGENDLKKLGEWAQETNAPIAGY